jgi:hypothetical protein
VFKEGSETSSFRSKNQAAPSVITFRRDSKYDVSSTYSGDNTSHDSRKNYKKSTFINSKRFTQRIKNRKGKSTQKTKQRKILDSLKIKFSEIEMNFKIKKKLDHIDKQIYKSIINTISRVDTNESEKLELVLKVV